VCLVWSGVTVSHHTHHAPRLPQADDAVKRYMLPADQIKNARTHYEHAHGHAHGHAHSRSMASDGDAPHDPDAYECTASAYGNNARRVQDIGDRKIYRFNKA
jgi:hypothetical protein